MLPNEVNERLELLLSSKQIKKDTFETVKKKLTDLVQSKQVDGSSEHIGPFTSHLAIAIERMKQSEGLEQMTEDVEEVVEKNPDLFQAAEKLVFECLDQPAKNVMTRAEIGFITLYLLLLQGQD